MNVLSISKVFQECVGLNGKDRVAKSKAFTHVKEVGVRIPTVHHHHFCTTSIVDLMQQCVV